LLKPTLQIEATQPASFTISHLIFAVYSYSPKNFVCRHDKANLKDLSNHSLNRCFERWLSFRQRL